MIRNFAIGGTSFDFIRGIALIFQKSISPRWSRKVIRDKRGFLPLFLRHLAAIRQSPQSFLIYPSVPRAGQKRVYFRVPRDFRGRLEICKRGGETAEVGREKWKRPPTRNNRRLETTAPSSLSLSLPHVASSRSGTANTGRNWISIFWKSFRLERWAAPSRFAPRISETG